MEKSAQMERRNERGTIGAKLPQLKIDKCHTIGRDYTLNKEYSCKADHKVDGTESNRDATSRELD